MCISREQQLSRYSDYDTGVSTQLSCGSSPGDGTISVYSKELTPLWRPSVKQSAREADQSSPTGAEVQYE